ncbi:chaperonin 10-like protein [Aspergillus heterothallicus]
MEAWRSVLAFWKFLASPDRIFFPSSPTCALLFLLLPHPEFPHPPAPTLLLLQRIYLCLTTFQRIFTMSFLRSVKNLAPLLDRVLVQRVKPEAKTASGIFLPESSVKEQNEAKVLAVGPGAVDRNGQRIPMGVSAGDRVLIPQFGGSPVKIGEEEYTLFRDSEILAKINE